jgi:hypothetical protein
MIPDTVAAGLSAFAIFFLVLWIAASRKKPKQAKHWVAEIPAKYIIEQEG